MRRKADAKALVALRGQRRWSESEGRLVVDALEASGESIPIFAQRVGLVPQRVRTWRKRLGRGHAERRALAAPAFLPVTVRSEVRTTALAMVESDGVRIEVANLDAMSAAWVAMVVKTLREAQS